MTDTPQVLAAKADAEQAQARFMATLHELQHRIAPSTIANQAWSGADLAEDAVDAVRKRPYAAGGAVAALAVFLAREPLWDFASRLVGRRKDEFEAETDELDDIEITEIEITETENVESA
jgi:hypothetical protein